MNDRSYNKNPSQDVKKDYEHESGNGDKPAKTDFYRSGLNSFLKLPLISREETNKLVERAQKAENAGRYKESGKIINEITNGNIPLLVKLAKDRESYTNRNMLELTSIGFFGVNFAVKTQDNEKGKFGSYMAYVIKYFMGKYVTYNDMLIRRPSCHVEGYRKIKRAQEKIGRPYPVDMLEKVAKMTGYSIKKVTRILDTRHSCNVVISFDRSYRDGDSKSDKNNGYNYMIDRKTEAPIKHVLLEERRNLLEKVMKQNLSFKERKILMYRYGLNNGNVIIPLRPLGKTFHLSGEGIRQIQKRAIKKLQRPKAKRELESLVESPNESLIA